MLKDKSAERARQRQVKRRERERKLKVDPDGYRAERAAYHRTYRAKKKAERKARLKNCPVNVEFD